MAETRKASCLCGAVTVDTTGEPETSMICSCQACQTVSGSAFLWSTYWDRAKAKVAGTSSSFDRAGAEGRVHRIHFCPTCGTSLFWEPDFAPDWIGVGGGMFQNGPALPEPRRAYWTRHRPAWTASISILPQLEEQGGH